MHAVRKKWKGVYIQQAMLNRQRRLQMEVAKPAVLRGPKKLHVLLLGLDRSGKTTFVYRTKLGRQIVSIPTVGANREVVIKPLSASRGGPVLERTYKFTDVGGITPMRLLWGEYLKDANKIDVFAFMVDANDSERIAQVSRLVVCRFVLPYCFSGGG
jgi:GTPase SAR1 family protein